MTTRTPEQVAQQTLATRRSGAMSDGIYRQAFGQATPVAKTPAPTPTIERIPRTVDGSTWYAHAEGPDGQTIGATSRTRRDVLVRFSEQWARFAS